jgi:hypothetical protein
MARCACNVENTDRNFITISDNMITISNITRDIDEGELRLYFVSSVSSGCNNACNLRSIKGIYRLITTPGKTLILVLILVAGRRANNRTCISVISL